MIRPAIHWIRRVLPPVQVLLSFLLAYLLFEGFFFALAFWLNAPEDGRRVLVTRDFIVYICCFGYGAFRVVMFHPLYRPVYRGWLKLTPWNSQKPLPLGPVHLVAQDLLVAGAFVLMLHHSGLAWCVAPLIMLFGYLSCLTMTFRFTGLPGTCYFMLYGLVSVIGLARYPYLMLGGLAFLYVVAYAGIRRSLARFPWRATPAWDEFCKIGRHRGSVEQRQELGWPFSSLQPKVPAEPLRAGEIALLSGLAGWLLFVVVSQPPDRVGSVMVAKLIHHLIGAACIFVRLATYSRCRHAPISLWGRICTFRWVIPGYDQVFLAPVLALLIVVFLPGWLHGWGLGDCLRYSVSLSLILFVCLTMPPSLRRWQLTGEHRLVVGSVNRQELQQI